MNLKELTNVKEYIDDALGKLGFIIEVLDGELFAGGDGDGESVGEGSDLSDEPVDPLEDGRLAAVHAYDLLAAVLDITEVHRKRYLAQRGVAGAGNRAGNTSGNTVASVERQEVLPGTAPVLKEGGSDGTSTNAKAQRQNRRFTRTRA